MKEGETQKLLARLRQLKDTVTAALSVDTAVAVQRIEKQTSAIEQGVSALNSDRDQQEILAWLYPVRVDAEENYKNALRLREPGTGNWLLRLPSFQAWTKQSTVLLRVSGLLGNGKSVLGTTIIEHLRVKIQVKTWALPTNSVTIKIRTSSLSGFFCLPLFVNFPNKPVRV